MQNIKPFSIARLPIKVALLVLEPESVQQLLRFGAAVDNGTRVRLRRGLCALPIDLALVCGQERADAAEGQADALAVLEAFLG